MAGDGNQPTVRLVRHSQRKRRATDRSNLRGMAPFLDPTTAFIRIVFYNGKELSGLRRRTVDDAADATDFGVVVGPDLVTEGNP